MHLIKYLYPEYKRKSNSRKKSNFKMVKNLGHSTKEDIQITKLCMKMNPMPLVIREMQIKTRLKKKKTKCPSKWFLKNIKKKKSNQHKILARTWNNQKFQTFQTGIQSVQQFFEKIWKYLRKLNLHLPCHPKKLIPNNLPK